MNAPAVFGQTPVPAPPLVPLWTNGTPGALGSSPADTPSLSTFVPSSNPTKSAVIVIPGGGYGSLSLQKEGDVIARWLSARGVAAFVLRYRIAPKYHHPIEIGDAQRAIRTVRSQATALGFASDHIGLWGFSAGGHLAATAGTQFDSGNPQATDEIDRQSSRPNFLILAYPVISFVPPYAHIGSRNNLVGVDPPAELQRALSAELNVTSNTPPTFLFSTQDDGTVQVMNSVIFYEALTQAKVAAEIHIYPHGHHGVGLAPNDAPLKTWPDEVARWMATNGWMSTDAAALITNP